MRPNFIYRAICTSALTRGAPWAEELARAPGGKKLGKQWPAVSRSRSSPKYAGPKSPTAYRYCTATFGLGIAFQIRRRSPGSFGSAV